MEGEQPQLGNLLTMVANHLLNGMVLQVCVNIHFYHGAPTDATPAVGSVDFVKN